MQTLRRERRKKFRELIVQWLVNGSSITDVNIDAKLLESELDELTELLADAATSESERRTDETFGEYKTSPIYKIYQENIGIITPMIADQLKDIERDYPEGWFEDAVKEALKNNVRKLAYVTTILNKWKVSGRETKKAETVKREEGKSSGYYA